jgi:hypothetical protein
MPVDSDAILANREIPREDGSGGAGAGLATLTRACDFPAAAKASDSATQDDW